MAWVFQDVKPLVQGRPIVMLTNAEGVYKKLVGLSSEPRRMIDKHVCRVVGWLLENYPSSQLTVRYVPRQENVTTDMMSRWSKRITKTVGPSRIRGTSVEEVHELREWIGANCMGIMLVWPP